MKQQEHRFTKSWMRDYFVASAFSPVTQHKHKIAEMVEYIESLHDKIDNLKLEIFMTENGLGEKDMINDTTYPHEIS